MNDVVISSSLEDYLEAIAEIIERNGHAHTKDIAAQFEEQRQRKDSVTEVNRSMDDPDVALIASNIYDVVDWCMEQMEPDLFFANMEKGYVALAPMRQMYDEGTIDGAFLPAIADILKENIALKGRICFDIICRLKGYTFT